MPIHSNDDETTDGKRSYGDELKCFGFAEGQYTGYEFADNLVCFNWAKGPRVERVAAVVATNEELLRAKRIVNIVGCV